MARRRAGPCAGQAAGETLPKNPFVRGDASRVVFSTPTEDETDVDDDERTGAVFTRHRPGDLKGHVKRRTCRRSRKNAVSPTRPDQFHHADSAATRVLEIRFAAPLERFRTLNWSCWKIAGADGQTLKLGG